MVKFPRKGLIGGGGGVTATTFPPTSLPKIFRKHLPCHERNYFLNTLLGKIHFHARFCFFRIRIKTLSDILILEDNAVVFHVGDGSPFII